MKKKPKISTFKKNHRVLIYSNESKKLKRSSSDYKNPLVCKKPQGDHQDSHVEASRIENRYFRNIDKISKTCPKTPPTFSLFYPPLHHHSCIDLPLLLHRFTLLVTLFLNCFTPPITPWSCIVLPPNTPYSCLVLTPITPYSFVLLTP